LLWKNRTSVCCSNLVLVHAHTHMLSILQSFVRDYPGGPVPEETFTHSHLKSSSILYQPPPSAKIHSILPAQTTCFTVSLHNLYSSPLRSTSWSRTLNFILRTFLRPIIVFFSQHMPIASHSCAGKMVFLVYTSGYSRREDSSGWTCN